MDIHVKILNFEHYNPRKDVKKPSWFRFDHDFFENHNFFIFSPAERLAWIYLLCLASRENKDVIPVYYAHADKIGGLSREVLDSAITKLSRLGVLSTGKSNTRTGKSNTSSHATRRDETDETGRDGTGRDETSAKPAPLKSHPLIEIWNQHRGELSAVKKIGTARLNAIAVVWPELSEDEWITAIKNVADSDFCNGKNDRAWVASFAWLLGKDKNKSLNCLNAFEGKYANRTPKAKISEIYKNPANVEWAKTSEAK